MTDRGAIESIAEEDGWQCDDPCCSCRDGALHYDSDPEGSEDA